jgi:hypothetical protein
MIHKKTGGARINADAVRASISTDLKFEEDDRLIQATRVGSLVGLALHPYTFTRPIKQSTIDRLNKVAVVDFICPREEYWEEFCSAVLFRGLPPIHILRVWMNTITKDQCRFKDTAEFYRPPSAPNFSINEFLSLESLDEVAKQIANAALGKK